MITQATSSLSCLEMNNVATKIEIRIGKNSYFLDKATIEHDFTNFEELFGSNPLYRLSSQHEIGWRFLFSCLDPDTFDEPIIESFTDFKIVIECIILSGSKKALQHLLLLNMPPYPYSTTELWQFYTAIASQYPPNLNAEVDTLLLYLHKSFSTLSLTVHSPVPEPFYVRGHQYRQLRLTMLTSELASNFTNYFPNVTKLVIKLPFPWKSIVKLLENSSKIEQLKLKVYDRDLVFLHEITQHCPKLCTLHLKGVSTPLAFTKALSGVSPFAGTTLPANLRVLSVKALTLLPGAISSIAKLGALEMLDLEHSFIDPIRELDRLTRCRSLRLLDMTNTRSNGPHVKALAGQVHLLSRSMPTTTILPHVIIEDFTRYDRVLSCSANDTCKYQFPADASKAPTPALLKELLANSQEHHHWSIQNGSTEKNRSLTLAYPPYDHRLAPRLTFYFSASPIECPDNRLRLATQMPFDDITCGDFWQAVVDLDVSVIAMVKEIETTMYFPKLFSSMQFTGQKGKPIEVQCISLKPLAHDITLRELLVANKKVWHLQIHWHDMQGLDETILSHYIEQFEQLEALAQGTSIVHCKAGVGRTGTFFGALIVKQLMRMHHNEPLYIDLEALLTGLRQQRMGMILTDAQLMTIRNYFALLHQQHHESNSSLQNQMAF